MRFLRQIGELKGLKHFGFEVLIVVIGVSITLIAQEIITNASQAREARLAVDAVEVDMVGLFLHASERLAVEPCRRAQVRALADKLQTFDATWTAEVPDAINRNQPHFVLPRILRTPSRPWGDDAWKALVASDTAIHIDRSQFTALSTIFGASQRILAAQDDALHLNGQLAHLAVTGPLDAPQRRAAYAQLGELSNIDGMIGLMSRQMRALILDFEFRNAGRFGAISPDDITTLIRRTRDIYGACVDAAEFKPFVDSFTAVTGKRVAIEAAPAAP